MRRYSKGKGCLLTHQALNPFFILLSSQLPFSLAAALDSPDIASPVQPQITLFSLSLACLILGHLRLLCSPPAEKQITFQSSPWSAAFPRNKSFLSRLVFSQLSSHWGVSAFHYPWKPWKALIDTLGLPACREAMCLNSVLHFASSI